MMQTMPDFSAKIYSLQKLTDTEKPQKLEMLLQNKSFRIYSKRKLFIKIHQDSVLRQNHFRIKDSYCSIIMEVISP